MRWSALGVLVAVVLAAGCGGQSEEATAYVDAVNGAQERFKGRVEALSRDVGATSTPAQTRRTLTAFRGAVDRTVEELQAIPVPAEVQPDHRGLIEETGAYAAAIDRARAGLTSSDTRRILAAKTRLVTAVDAVNGRINRTIAAINRKLGT